MKTKITISLLALIFIAGDFIGGCEEEELEPDYITVNVSTIGEVHYDNLCIDWLEGLTVRIDIVKAGGETFTFERVTNKFCGFEVPTVSFKLYREQPIEAKANVQGGIQGYEFVPAIKTLNWLDVYPMTDFGETYSWEVFLFIQCRNK